MNNKRKPKQFAEKLIGTGVAEEDERTKGKREKEVPGVGGESVEFADSTEFARDCTESIVAVREPV